MRITGRKNHSKIDWNLIQNLYSRFDDMYNRQKLSLNEIAKILNTSPDSIKKKMLELGFSIRNREESAQLKNELLYGKGENNG
jgi:hypothetical protein